MRRGARAVALGLIALGGLLTADALLTLAWQEPATGLLAILRRAELNHRLQALGGFPLSPGDTMVLARLAGEDRRMAYLARREGRLATPGEAIGRIEIRRIGLRADFVQGTDRASLEAGPGHYPQTALPGLGRTVAIAGHRTTYLAPFRDLDELRPGDPITLAMPYGTFTYRVQRTRIVPANALWITREVGHEQLVLSACDPVYSAARRIVVFALLRWVEPSAPPPAAPALRAPRTGRPTSV